MLSVHTMGCQRTCINNRNTTVCHCLLCHHYQTSKISPLMCVRFCPMRANTPSNWTSIHVSLISCWAMQVFSTIVSNSLLQLWSSRYEVQTWRHRIRCWSWSGLWRGVVLYEVTIILEECVTSVFILEMESLCSPEMLITIYRTVWCQPTRWPSKPYISFLSSFAPIRQLLMEKVTAKKCSAVCSLCQICLMRKI